MVEEGVEFRVALGVVGHLKQRKEQIRDEVLETLDQLVCTVHITGEWRGEEKMLKHY